MYKKKPSSNITATKVVCIQKDKLLENRDIKIEKGNLSYGRFFFLKKKSGYLKLKHIQVEKSDRVKIK